MPATELHAARARGFPRRELDMLNHTHDVALAATGAVEDRYLLH
ncbi:MAG: hypothetical protein ABL871_14180 [Terricaulis sp.]